MTGADGLLFDMDGLLLDSEAVAQDAFVEVSAPLGLSEETARHVFLGLVGGSAHQTRTDLLAILPSGTDYAQFDRAWRVSFTHRMSGRIPLKPRVPDLLTELARRGHKMAVVTSTDTHHARDHLERSGLLPHFHTVIGGDAVPANKPDPAPYLTGAAAIGADPTACIAFEDSDRGTMAAVAAGCTVWQIPDLRPPKEPLPDLGHNIAETLEDALHRAGLL